MIVTKQGFKLIFVIISATLICGLIALEIYVSTVLSKKAETDDRIVGIEEDSKIEYKPLEILSFQDALGDFLYNGLMLDDDTCKTVSSNVISAMSEARIPTKKMLAFSRFLKKNVDFISSIGKVSIGSFEFIADLDLENFEDSLMGLLNRSNESISSFMSSTELTPEEISLFLYCYLSKKDDIGYVDILNKLGKELFTKTLSSTILAIGAVCMTYSEKPEATQASILQSTLYELGNNYVETIKAIGVDGLETLLFLQNNWAFSDTMSEREIELTGEVKKLIKGRFGDLFYLFGNTLKGLSASDCESILKYVNLGNEEEGKTEAYIYAYSKIAASLRRGLDELYLKSTEVKSDAGFMEKYNSLFLALQKLTDLVLDYEERDYTAYGAELDTYMTRLFASVNGLSEKPLSIEGIRDTEEAEIDELRGYADSVKKAANLINGVVSQVLIVSYGNYLIKAYDFDDLLEYFQVTAEEQTEKELEKLFGEYVYE